MIETEIDPKQEAFLLELDRYVNGWVAIIAYDTEDQAIVGNGATIIEARTMAESNGFTDVTFLKVPSPDKLFVPRS